MRSLESKEIKMTAHGRWSEILSAFGIPRESLQNRHGPCPACGGKDRFRFDDRYGNGDFYCNQCGAGDGFALLMRVEGWDFKTMLGEVGQYVGVVTNLPTLNANNHRPKPRKEPVADLIPDRQRRLKAVLLHSLTLDNDKATPGLRYLETRLGTKLSSEFLKTITGRLAPHAKQWFDTMHRTSFLYLHPNLPYYDGELFIGCYPALVAPVIDNYGMVVSVHRTYLNNEGSGKADIATPKKLMPALRSGAVRGSAVRLGGIPPDGVLGIAEGIETALAVLAASGMTCWSAISAGGISSFNPPSEISTIHIWADRDHNCVGQNAAIKLADRLTSGAIATFIHLPTRGAGENRDWLDEYLCSTSRKHVCNAN